jgi:hypothetical protein
MWALFNWLRGQVKYGITLFIWDLFLLVITLMSITAGVQRIMHPAIIIIGCIWVLMTAGAIWHARGVYIDSLLVARILDVEIGKEFTHALNLFFVTGCTTVVFFALFPVYKYWPSALLLPVLLIGLVASSNLADKKTNWDYFYRGYLWLIMAALASILIFGMTSFTQESLTEMAEKPWDLSFLGSWLWRMILFGAAMLAVLLIPEKYIKIPGKGLLGALGVILLLVGLTLVVFPEILNLDLGPSSEAAKASKPVVETFKPTGTARQTHREPEPAPASQLTSTGITLQPGEVIIGTKDASAPPTELIVLFPDGEAVTIDKKWWTADNKIRLTHVGANVKGRPGQIMYQRAAGRYHFEKESSAGTAASRTVKAIPAIYYPASQPPANCPFE